MIEVAEVRYKADITAGALKLPESRLIADLLLRHVDPEGWKDAIVTKNVLQARNPATARRLTTLIRGRLEMMGPDLWKLIRDGKGTVTAHAVFAAVRIPERIFKYLLTRMIFKLPNAKAISYVRHAAPNLESLSPQKVSNLDLEQGVCYVQTDDDCTDILMRVPQALDVRPRCTMHGGSTIRQGDVEVDGTDTAGASEVDDEPEIEFEEFDAELCPVCGEELLLRRSRSGPMLVCNTYPKCKYARKA